jgi:hypothetical protein
VSVEAFRWSAACPRADTPRSPTFPDFTKRLPIPEFVWSLSMHLPVQVHHRCLTQVAAVPGRLRVGLLP